VEGAGTAIVFGFARHAVADDGDDEIVVGIGKTRRRLNAAVAEGFGDPNL